MAGADNSHIAEAKFQKLIPFNPVKAGEFMPGLKAAYFEGHWPKLPDFNTLTSIKNTVLESISLPEFAREEDFGILFEGYIKIPYEGLYQFFLNSDDGSTLTIADTLVVNNDGLHGEGDVAGEIALKAGCYTIKVLMFQATGDRALSLSVKGPNIEKQIVPQAWLLH